MRLLFVKHALVWPRSSGHDVHGFYMMKALADLGHEVALATVVEPSQRAVNGARLAFIRTFEPAASEVNGTHQRLTPLQERFRSYYGVESSRLVALSRMASAFRADAVVGVGLDVLPYLAGLKGSVRVWYAGDEWVRHHLSQVRPALPSSWANMKDAAVKGLYERAYAGSIDRTWVVSRSERFAMRWLAGMGAVDVLPNGVDADYYRPVAGPEQPLSAVFWGRLDFGPNIQALVWFCRSVWPKVRKAIPGARFTIIGFRLTNAVKMLAGADGIELLTDLPDLRAEVCQHSVVVFPFVSGGGIKNKLLEAASLGKAIVCTPRTCGGLHTATPLPLVKARRPADWVSALSNLWANDDRRRALGAEARQWVVQQHTWEAAAGTAVASLEQSIRVRRRA